MEKFYHILQKTFCICAAAAVALIFLLNGYAIAVIITVAIIAALRHRQIPHFTLILLLGGIALRVIVILVLHPPVISDWNLMYGSARSILEDRRLFQHMAYFTLWAYQTAFVAWEAMWLALWDSLTCLKLVNAVMAAGTVCLLYRIAREYAGECAAQSAALLLTLQPFALTFHTLLSDQIPSGFFLMAGVWLLICGDCNRLSMARFPLAGLVLQIGNLLRSEGILVLTAIVAWAVFEIARRPEVMKRLLPGVLSLFLVYTAVGTAADQIIRVSGLNENGLQNGNPAWKVVTGLNYTTKGMYSADDWNRIAATLDENHHLTEETRALQRSMIEERLQVPPNQLANHLLHKIQVLWGVNNLNWAFQHTIEKQAAKLIGPLTRYDILLLLQQYNLGLFLIALGLAGLGLWNRKEWAARPTAAYLPFFVVFAAFCAFLLIEVQPRYVYLPQQFVFCGAALGINRLTGEVKKKGIKMNKISVIVPCYNEEEALPVFYQEITRVAAQMAGVAFEFIFVDDGSKDRTLSLLRELSQKDSRVRFISFSRNFGKEAGILAGLKAAKGDFITLMDADLQDPPELLPALYQAVTEEGYDCAATCRITRKGEPPLRSFFARLFYRLMHQISDTDIVDGARDYRIMRRPVVDAVLSMGEYNRFSKGIFGWVGFRTKWVPFANIERVAGKTKWSFWKLFLYSLEGITAFSTAPLAIASALGIFLCLIAFLFICVILVKTLAFGDPVSGWPSMMCVILFLSGIQLFCMGILGQYLAKTYMEAKRRPVYLIRETEDGPK